jgi:hypothetical protein
MNANMLEIALQRLSICPCGYAVLDDRITVGTLYPLDLDTIRGGSRYFCGGCKTWHEDVAVVKASQVLHPQKPMAMLPYELFLTNYGAERERARRARKDP